MSTGTQTPRPAAKSRGKQSELPAVLDRFESKYTIPFFMVDAISSFIAPYCSMDKYSEAAPDNFYRINSLYFDTPDFLFLRQRIFKAENRFNMRVRSYGDAPQLPYYLELKQRQGDIVRKYRAKTWAENLEQELCGPATIVDGGQDPDKNAAHTDLFRRTLLKYNARPVVLVQYMRKAYLSDCDEYARVTFDIGLRYMPQSEFVPVPVQGAVLPCDVQTCFDGGCSVILELKCYTSFVPLWMVDLVRVFQLKRRGFSKYATSVRPVLSRFKTDGAFVRQPIIDCDCDD